MAPILVEPLNEKAYELLRQLEALHVLRVVEPLELPVVAFFAGQTAATDKVAPPAPRKWAGAAATLSPISTEDWHKHIEELRNEWERDI